MTQSGEDGARRAGPGPFQARRWRPLAVPVAYKAIKLLQR
jgi:hypothetical protein